MTFGPIRQALRGTLLLASCVVLQAGAAMAERPDVAIDVGHTLDEPGVISASGTPEFEMNRHLAEAVADDLRNLGLRVQLINADGRQSVLTARTREARDARLFAAIHHDSVRERFLPVRDERFAGFSIWVSRNNRASATSIACARQVADHLIGAGFAPSHYHADPVFGEGRPVVDWRRGVFARDALAVLNTARSPAILIEAGVVVNPAEEARLRKPEVFRNQATAIAEGLWACLKSRH